MNNLPSIDDKWGINRTTRSTTLRESICEKREERNERKRKRTKEIRTIIIFKRKDIVSKGHK